MAVRRVVEARISVNRKIRGYIHSFISIVSKRAISKAIVSKRAISKAIYPPHRAEKQGKKDKKWPWGAS